MFQRWLASMLLATLFGTRAFLGVSRFAYVSALFGARVFLGVPALAYVSTLFGVTVMCQRCLARVLF